MTQPQLDSLKASLPRGWQSQALSILRRKKLRYHKSSLTKVLRKEWENLDILEAIVEVRERTERERQRVEARMQRKS